MGFSYDITTSQKDKRSMVGLSACHLLYNVVNLFISTFLIAHIYSLTTDMFSYVLNVGIYQLSTYGTMLIAYFLFSFVVDKTNRIWIYRIANIIEAVLVIVTIFYGKDLAKIVVLAGLLNGLAHSAYYASYNVLKQEMVSRKSMGTYVVAMNVLCKVVNVVCPILLGALIDISTYAMVAVYVLAISVIQTIISFFIKAKRPQESEFNLRKYIKKIKDNPEMFKCVRSIYSISVLYGFTTIVSALLNINIMIHFGSSFSLGLITSVFAILSVVVLLLFNKFTKAGKRSWVFIVSAILQVVGAVIFSVVPNMVTLLIFNLGLTICEVIISAILDLYRNKHLKEMGLYDDIAEHQCIIESIFQIVRVISFSILIVLGLIKSFVLFQVCFVIFLIVYAVTSILLMRYENNLTRNIDE